MANRRALASPLRDDELTLLRCTTLFLNKKPMSYRRPMPWKWVTFVSAEFGMVRIYRV